MNRKEKDLSEERRKRVEQDVEEAVEYAEWRHSMIEVLEHPVTTLRRDRQAMGLECPHCGDRDSHPQEARDICPTYERFEADR